MTARRSLLGAAALVLLVNAFVLARVAWNRTGEPDATVTLTERELPRAWPWHAGENSGVSLRPVSRLGIPEGQGASENGDADTLAEPHMRALGFDVRLPATAAEARRFELLHLSRPAWGVFEAEGPAWEAWKQRTERRLAALDLEVAAGRKTVADARSEREAGQSMLRGGSRLFIIDVGADADLLRQSHPDRRRQFILPVLVRPRLVGRNWDGPCFPPACRLAGWVEPRISEVNVPAGLQSPLPPAPTRDDKIPRYEVDLAIGRGHEPWVTAIRPVQAPK
jgi:hypothetical protein